jgi:branched-subunit amino acid ABC-type transport system permease component
VPAMNDFLRVLIPGISDGSVYALAALGLVLTFKTSGVFNFAHGAVAAASAYVFYDLRIEQGLPWPVAFVISLVLVGLLGGLLLERLGSLLADVPLVNVVVATVGLLVLIQSLSTAVYGASSLQFPEFLPTAGVDIGSVRVTAGDAILTAVSLGSAGALFYLFERTRTGKAMTAVVDNPSLLSLQGTDPTVVRRLAWVLGTSFAALSGMLLAPKIGVSVGALVLLVIAAYGAAAIGLFNSLPQTVVGGLVIGITINYIPTFTADSTSIVVQSIPANLPFLVLFAALLVVPPHKFKTWGAKNARRLPPIRTYSPSVTAAGMGAGLFVLVLLPAVIDGTDLSQYSSALGFVIIFASLGLLMYTSGQISLCQMGFAAIGATTTGQLLARDVPWLLALLIGGLVTVPAGVIVAYPAIRLSGIYVAIATFGFGILLQTVAYPSELMFGLESLVEVPRPVIFGIDFTSDTGYYYLALIVTVLASAVVLAVRRSRLGLLLRALSDSPNALDAHGANTTLTRVLVFGIASFLAGIGGGIIAGTTESASGAAGGVFDFTFSLVIVAVLGFCGRRPLLSPFIAAAVFQVTKIYPPFNDETFLQYQGVLFGAVAIAVAVAPALEARRVRGSGGGSDRGRRAAERTGHGPVAERMVAANLVPVQPAARPSRPAGGQRDVLQTGGR